MNTALILIKRDVKMFFKDKAMFLTSLLTPGILLVLYATFLANIYRDSFASGMPEGAVSDALIDGLVGAQLISSLLAVSCVTVAFCSNFLMVQDKANGTVKDLMISPVSASKLSVSYYVSTFISTLIISLAAIAICLVYVAFIGFYMSFVDLLLLLIDVLALIAFGTALSSIINFFLTTQGQISAVGSIVSAGYGFICGAYMPISSFGEGLRRVIAFLPGTYGTSLLRNHTMRGVLSAIEDEGVPTGVVDELRDLLDCNVYFFDTAVSEPVMYAILFGSGALLLGVYILMNFLRKKDS